MNDTNFSFVMPADLSKSKDGKWKVKGLASTESIDKQGEIILQKGLDLSNISAGYLNFDHDNSPESTIGTLSGYTQTDKGLYIEGELFKNHDKAKAVQQIMSSMGEEDYGRVGLSVEGSITERCSKNPSIIKKCSIKNVAITLNPVNTNTYVDLVKSMNSSENTIEFNTEKQEPKAKDAKIFTADQLVDAVQKALSVSGGYGDSAPADLSGGDALSVESMDKKKKKKPAKLAKSEYSLKLTSLLDKFQSLYPQNSREDIWECIKERAKQTYDII